jgi:hypothetical protein
MGPRYCATIYFVAFFAPFQSWVANFRTGNIITIAALHKATSAVYSVTFRASLERHWAGFLSTDVLLTIVFSAIQKRMTKETGKQRARFIYNRLIAVTAQLAFDSSLNHLAFAKLSQDIENWKPH